MSQTANTSQPKMDLRSTVTSSSFTGLFGLVSTLLSTFLIAVIGSRFIRRDLNCLMIRENLKKLRKDVIILTDRHGEYISKIDEAELAGKTVIPVLEKWIDAAEVVLKKMEEIDEDSKDIVSLWWINPVRFPKKYKFGKKVVEKMEEVKELLRRATFTDVATTTREVPAQFEALPPTPTNSPALDTNLDKVLEHLSDDGTKIIAVTGMGGVGKTTLLHALNYYYLHHQSTQIFDQVVFLVVSRRCRPGDLKAKLAEYLGLSSGDSKSIYNRLAGKRTLLLLDDLWQAFDLAVIGIPIENGSDCKVVFSTRLANVCSSMKASKVIEVKCLEDKEAWNLFKENVGESVLQSDDEIPPIAESVAKECGGLPLALIIIGQAMSSKTTRHEWEDALERLRTSCLSDVPDLDERLLRQLKYSYDELPKRGMKRCFLSCALWPEGHQIEVPKLIECWMGMQELRDWRFNMDVLYSRGYTIVEQLKKMCLLQRGRYENHVKLHDVIRDMAIWIASGDGENDMTWLVRAGLHLTERDVRGLSGADSAEVISLMYNDIDELPENISACPHLSVLIIQENNIESIRGGLLLSTPALRYLDISSTYISELPIEIGSLTNLEFLNMSSTSISRLPAEFANLQNLKYLLLRNTSIRKIPYMVLSSLQSLEVIDLFCCFEADATSPYGGSWEQREYEILNKRLKGLALTVSDEFILDQVYRLSHVSIVALTIQVLIGTGFLELFSAGTGSHDYDVWQSVRELVIRWTQLPVLIVSPSIASGLKRLEHLALLDMPLLQEIEWPAITPKKHLVGLRSLEIIQCHSLTDISWVAQLPCLSYLYVCDCKRIEVVVDEMKDVDLEEPSRFPKLEYMELSQLPNLYRICCRFLGFNSLKCLVVYLCPRLKTLPFYPERISPDLQEIYGEGEWWEGLEDENIKSSLGRYFRERNVARQNINPL